MYTKHVTRAERILSRHAEIAHLCLRLLKGGPPQPVQFSTPTNRELRSPLSRM